MTIQTITIERTYWSGGVLGRVPELGIWTLEPPWLDNQADISCVPEGMYDVRPDQEGRWKGYPELQNVLDRTEIVIHPLNKIHESLGCIGPGLKAHIDAREVPTVRESRKAFNRIQALGDHFRVVIKRKV